MKILLITTRFPPDTAIAAVRPYMFAKYLTRLGHQVTVIRSGEISSSADNSWPIDGLGFTVVSYMGDDDPAEKIRRGELINISRSKSRISFMPKSIQILARKTYHFIFSNKEFENQMKDMSQRLEMQKECLGNLKNKGEEFDVVLATYGALENVFAGQYASKLFNCKYILDFRDMIAQSIFQNKSIYKQYCTIQKNAVMSADICTCVSMHATNELCKQAPGKKIITLYNGYEAVEGQNSNSVAIKDSIFSICYTGQLYSGMRDATELFHAISANCKEGKIDRERVQLYYAGTDFDLLQMQAKKYGLQTILVNMGYIGRDEIAGLQRATDIFTVLSWNTSTSRGILTGKLYEGIRCKRPILAIVSGNEAESELKAMNEKYHYGFCFEEANKDNEFNQLKDWILEQYQRKMCGKEIISTADETFFTDFRYDNLTNQLNEIILSLFEKNI